MTASSSPLVDLPGPQLVAGVERRRLHEGTVVARPDGRCHLLLHDHELALLDALDGSLAVPALAARFGTDAEPLVAELAAGGFLVGVPAPVEPRVTCSTAGVEIAGFDRLVGALARAGAGRLVSWAGAVGALVVGTAGAVALLAGPAASGAQLAGGDAVATVWLLVALALPASFVHETAHALVLHRYGRQVGRVGFGFYWGALSFYVDATDALLLPRRRRLAQTAAGPLADLAVAGALGVAAWVAAPGTTGEALRVLALVAFVDVAVNLVPLLTLDGYWLLADALDEPDLRRRSLRALWRWRRPATARDRLLAALAVASLLFGAVVLAAELAVWTGRLVPLVVEAATASLAGLAGAALFVGPLAVGLAAQAVAVAVELHRGSTTRAREGGDRR